MITREQIPSVLDHSVYDTQGNKIGDAKHIFLDDVSGRPEWASVKTGMFGARESFVPIRDANLVEDRLEVPFDKAMVKEAPTVDVDSGGHLSADEEHRLYEYYGVDWDTSWQQANQREAGWTGDAGAAGTAGAAGQQLRGTEETTQQGRQESAETIVGPTGVAPGTAAETPSRSAPMPDAEQQPQRGANWEDSLTRSEEQMHISTERTAVGRARLRKYVVTEHTEQIVPLSHEEVRVEREVIPESERSRMGTSEVSEGQREVTLHAERPVIETETVPVERVRLNIEERTEQETVRGEVRKEKIDVELPEDQPGTGQASDTSGRDKPGRRGR